METYELFTKDPIRKIEEIILYDAIPVALENIANELDMNASPINISLPPAPILAANGLRILRHKGQENKQIYELFHGCILTAYLSSVDLRNQYELFYPEDESYDFLITKHPMGKIPDFTPTDNKEIHKKGDVYKVELAELYKLADLEKIIINKSKYTKRILLISVACNDSLNFETVCEKAITNNNGFDTIWLMSQTKQQTAKNKSYFLIAELIKYKKIYPPFELPIDWTKIQDKISEIL